MLHLALALSLALPAQEDPKVHDGIELPPVVITATRSEQAAFEAQRSIESVGNQRRRELQARDVPETLDETTGVYVQRTNRGAGAPIIRGLVGPQNLILVDGVRFNTSTFRTGPNQYLALIDPSFATRTEVIRGPSSVLYGNGAMGGVMHILTLEPALTSGGISWTGLASGHIASADLGGGGTLRGGVESEHLSAIVGGSFTHGGALRAGGGLEQPNSEYDAGYWQARVLWSPEPSWRITASYLGALMRDAGRTDSLGRGEIRLYDNDDHLVSARAQYDGDGALEHARATVVYHRLFELVDRYNCTTKEDQTVADLVRCSALDDAVVEKKRRNEDTVDVMGGELEARLGFWERRIRVTAGFDAYQDFVGSTREDAAASDGFRYVPKDRGEFSDGSRYLDLGAFLSVDATLLDVGERHFQLRASAGGRFSHFRAHAPDVPGIGDVDYEHSGFVASAGLQGILPGALNIYATFVQGFRAPNLQETTVLGNTGSKFEVPNADLGPERSDTVELGARANAGPIALGAAYFYSMLKDAIDEEAATHEGASEVDGAPVVRRVNAAEGVAQGVEGSLSVHVWRFTLTAGVAWMEADLTSAKGETYPARRIPPVFGTAALRYDHPGGLFYVEAGTRWSGRQDRLHPSDEKDLRMCETSLHSGLLQEDCEGTPGWVTLGIRGGYRPLQYLRFDLSLANITDEQYRNHASGYYAPGIDGRLTATASF